jgi:glycosyltransferase involved in cell wall biosynthesis
VIVIPNALPEDFINQLHPSPEKAFKRKEILMMGSLKLYKGTLEFLELAGRLPQFHFTLVINDTQNHINRFLAEYKLKTRNNLSIYPRQDEVASFYNRTSIVLNLSNKSLFIETFGLTALEAMYAGLPAIVPTVGGIAELVEDNINGYKIDVQDLDAIEKKIVEILTNKQLYQKLAENALSASKKYDERKMIDTIVSQL